MKNTCNTTTFTNSLEDMVIVLLYANIHSIDRIFYSMPILCIVYTYEPMYVLERQVIRQSQTSSTTAMREKAGFSLQCHCNCDPNPC